MNVSSKIPRLQASALIELLEHHPVVVVHGFVFFLIFYAPYSKVAHLLYRTLALVFAKRIGRTTRQ
jgi:hypothetical protein